MPSDEDAEPSRKGGTGCLAIYTQPTSRTGHNNNNRSLSNKFDRGVHRGYLNCAQWHSCQGCLPMGGPAQGEVILKSQGHPSLDPGCFGRLGLNSRNPIVAGMDPMTFFEGESNRFMFVFLDFVCLSFLTRRWSYQH